MQSHHYTMTMNAFCQERTFVLHFLHPSQQIHCYLLLPSSIYTHLAGKSAPL